MEKRRIKSRNKTVDIVQVALMAAMAFIVTYVIEIPVGTKAVLHLGDTIVFAAAILLGKKKAALAAALGMGLFDLLSPYAIWAPFTFVIKGVMAYIAASIALRNAYNGENLINNIIGFAIAGIWMILGYFIAGGIIYGSFIVALGDIPGNVIQVAAGIILSIPLIKALKRANIFKNNL
ncbi:ECF transporter S component [Candidatus Clostridium stratigraminis]|uniref:ECF transporter S component n=1 Tax=Candidatus Clostridium stratigraminis TaxID=3381661 RepID=A0ABW8T289_9CLOT